MILPVLMTRAWLIRHGESESNARRPTDHPVTVPLTERGRDQAERVAHAFDRAPDLVVVSPYRRAQETATPTLRAFPGVEVVEWPVQEFTYLAPARYQGTTVDDRRTFVGDYWRRLDPDFLDGAGAESFRDLAARVERVREMLLAVRPAGSGRFIAIFSHGQFIRMLLWWCLRGTREVDARAMTQFLGFLLGVVVPNGGIIPVTGDEDGLRWGEIRVDHLGEISWPDEASHDAIWTEGATAL
jgi:2,3-bisphosphoglycerate-dependent phosphoglycerate mutase